MTPSVDWRKAALSTDLNDEDTVKKQKAEEDDARDESALGQTVTINPSPTYTPLPGTDDWRSQTGISPNASGTYAGQSPKSTYGRGQSLKGNATQVPTKDDIISALQPIIAGMGGTAMGVGVSGTMTPAVGAPAGAATYLSLNHILEMLKDKPQDYDSEVGTAATNLATQEIGNKLVAEPLIRAMKAGSWEAAIPGSVVGKLREFMPTFSGYMMERNGPNSLSANASKWIEDIFGAGSKRQAIENSADIGAAKIQALAQAESGRPVNVLADPEKMADAFQAQIKPQITQLYKASSAEANRANLWATSNVQTVQKLNPQANEFSQSLAGKPYNALNPQEQQAVNKFMAASGVNPTLQQNIVGPVNLDKILQDGHDFIYGGREKSLIPPDPNDPLIKAYQGLINETNAQFDKSGKLVSSDPISFKDAWNFKQKAGEYAFGDRSKAPNDAAIPLIDSRFQKVYGDFDDAIENSMKTWKNNGPQALQAWRNSAAIARARLDLFNEDGLKQLINNRNANVPFIDDILRDPKKVDRAMRAGYLPIPSTEPGSNGAQLLSTNMRQDLRSYKMMQMLQNSWIGEPGSAKGMIDPRKFDAQLNDPKWASVREKLFSQQNLKDLSDIVNGLAYTQQSMTKMGWLSNPKIWATTDGMYLASRMFSGSLPAGLEHTAGLASVRLSAGATAKLMFNNPQTAARLAAMAKGMPLNASEEAVGRGFINALNGTRIYLVGNDGRETPATVRNGQVQLTD